ncbi:CidA/LrgA family protein [Alkalihalobacillus sp. MEB130]|uniref:CidA/LrgA family protein n=1 Tax=Alkalihalobacillus sp. MEB130 TaxID=2976704 RepID=UPI0028DD4410|nr:CidA/LrgA family protein [Alkalihalobacillus sp. MEB130]MDT8859339.1 CidA/LrgA family protein [Alkalihalobacillus sp. MEB130]
MIVIRISIHIAVLTCFYLLGVGIQRYFELMIPGSIIGMLLLFLALSMKLFPLRYIEEGSSFILRHMPLLFLPVTVGILQFLDVFSGGGFLLILITFVSTLIVMAVSGIVGQTLVKKKEVDKQ